MPGSRWVSRRGKHEGNEVEVTQTSDVSVWFVNRGGGANFGKQKADDSKTHRITRETFAREYMPREALAGGDAQVNGAFRRAAPPKRKQAEAPQPSLQMNGYAFAPGTPLNISIETVTPELAKTWLERGGTNRSTSPRRVRKYAAAMRRGEWQLTGEAIKLNADSQVRDGKHRLEAVVESGVSIQSLVVRNLDEGAFDVLDSGRPRSTSDIIGMHGFTYRTAAAAAARGLLLIDRFGHYTASSREVDEAVSTPTVLRYAEEHKEVLEEAIRYAQHLQRAGFVGGVGLYATLFVLLLRVDRDAALLFAEKLTTGANLEPNDPILRFRNRMIGERLSSAQKDREVYLAIGIKVWNAWRKGESLEKLIWRGQSNNEPFPAPV
jgi:hypothetical protein